MNRCTNCSGVIEDDTGKQVNGAWLDDYCLETLASRGYLVGIDIGGQRANPTPLTFWRDGELVSYLAPRKFLRERDTTQVKECLEGLPDSELVPFE